MASPVVSLTCTAVNFSVIARSEAQVCAIARRAYLLKRLPQLCQHTNLRVKFRNDNKRTERTRVRRNGSLIAAMQPGT
jgi:hypothetical protein